MKYKKAIFAAVSAAVVLGAAAFGIYQSKKTAPPAQQSEITTIGSAAVPSEAETAVQGETEEILIGLSDETLTDDIKADIEKLNAVLESYATSSKRKNDLISSYGFLYNYSAKNNVTVKDLVNEGVVDVSEDVAQYTDILYMRASDLVPYAQNIDKNDDKLQLFTAFNSKDGYYISNDYYSEGMMLEKKDYEQLVMSYSYAHGEIRNPEAGSNDYLDIMDTVNFEGEYDVKHIACDSAYAAVVVGSLEDTKIIKEYVLAKDGDGWHIAVDGLETSEHPAHDVNMVCPKMELGLLPKYTIANYEPLQNGFTKYEEPLVKIGLIDKKDVPASYDCGTSGFAYMEFGDKRLIGCVGDSGKLEFYPVRSKEEAIAYMLEYNSDPPVFIIKFHN